MTEVTGGLAFVVGTLDPYDAATAGGVAVLYHVHDPLRRRDSTTGELCGGLAAGPTIQVGEHEYELSLKTDATFSDGTPVRASDAVAAVRTMIQATGMKGQLLGESLRAIRDASVISETTLRLHTAGPMPQLDERLALVRVIPEGWQQSGAARAMAPATGPYCIRSSRSDEVVLVPAERYQGSKERPLLTFRASVDASQRLDRLLAGEFDAIEDPPMSAKARIDASADYKFARLRSQNILFLMFNCGDPRLGDARVRRAIVHAIDSEELSREANGGQLEPADSLLPSWHPDHVHCPMYPRTDPAAARALLTEAGYGNGLELRLAVSSASWVSANAESVMRQLARVGVDVSVTVAHTADLFSTEVPDGDYDLLLSSGDPSVYGVDGEFLLRWYLGRTWASGYCHWSGQIPDELVRLLDQASMTASGPQQRLLAEVQYIGAQQVPIAALGHRTQPSAWGSQLSGFRPSRTTGLDLRNPFL